MTQRYAHLSPQYMAGAVGKLDSVFGEVMPAGAASALEAGEALPSGSIIERSPLQLRATTISERLREVSVTI
jgi:hypothetical protein